MKTAIKKTNTQPNFDNINKLDFPKGEINLQSIQNREFPKGRETISYLKENKHKMKDSLKSATSNLFFNNNIPSNKQQNTYINDFSDSKTSFEKAMMGNTRDISNSIKELSNFNSNINDSPNHLVNSNYTYNPLNKTLSDKSSLMTPNIYGYSSLTNFNKNTVNLEELYLVQNNLNEIVSLIYNNRIKEHIVEVDISFLNKYSQKNNMPQSQNPSRITNLLKTDINKVEILRSLCEERFEFFNTVNIFILQAYFSDNNNGTNINNYTSYSNSLTPLSKEIKKFFNLEMLFFVCLVCYITENPKQENIIFTIGNILSTIYQIFLFIIEMILVQVSSDFENNSWLIKLKNCVNLRLRLKLIKSQEVFIISQHNKILLNMLKIFIGKNLVSRDLIDLNKIVLSIIENIDVYSNYYTKDIVLSIKSRVLNNFREMREREQLNKPITIPFLKPLAPSEARLTYTLVLDLDETLIHYSPYNQGELYIRPGAENFLKEISQYYEIVIFTAALQDYADWILDKLDPNKEYISARLYRQHTTIKKNTYVKDISNLGRDLNKTIIVDNVWENFQLQNGNGIYIKTWTNDENDTCLIDLVDILKEIVKERVKDVKVSLLKIRDLMTRSYLEGEKDPYKAVVKKLVG